jgi:hypothetical protein
MGESGCLKDIAVQNLKVVGSLEVAGTISGGLFGAGTIAVVASATDNTAVTGSLTLTQPANTFIRNIYVMNRGAAAVTITGAGPDAAVALQVGTAATANLIFGPGTVAVTTGNIIDAASADDGQSWPVNGVGKVLDNMTGAGTNAHVLLNANLDSVAAALSVAQTGVLFSAVSRNLVYTITSLTASQANAPISAATWRILVEYSPIV